MTDRASVPPFGTTLNTIALRTQQVAKLLQLWPFDGSTPERRAQERHRRAVLSAGAAAFAKAVSIGTALISVPLTLHYLGPERYGMWMTMCSFIAMLSFADLGMGNGLLNAVAAANGEDNRAAIRGLVSSAFLILSCLALMIGSMSVAVYPFVHWAYLFNVHSEPATQEAGPAIAIFLICFALAIPLGIVQKVQTGLQQGFSASLWQCGASLLGLVSLLLAIHLQCGLPWLVMALLGGPLVTNILNSIFYFGVQARDVAPSLRFASGSGAIRIARLGLLFLVLQIVVAVAYSSDNLVIAHMLGAEKVAEYFVPAQMFGLVTTVLNIALAPLWPAYGEAIARGDHAWVKHTLKRSFFLAVCLATAASTVLVLAGPKLLALWVGNSIEPPFVLLLGLGIWKVVEAGGNATGIFLNGANVVRLQVILAGLMGIAAIVLKIVLVERIGVAGVPWATILAYVIFSAVPLAVIVPRIVRGRDPFVESAAKRQRH